ncbi:S8/S53 family peptidase [Pseudomonas sp. SG20056]|uniref:S8/S53 family peptidase n=1 Tax=Pseudomonas sp. SG20056 TaxID=3074146 RepID=UPI00287F641A|nr:S8/S53 family peptidase [Pseudomonas sp. SG20056]WNF47372.1 S8/S53 family peptidase [Pseudomonas sp. SG20056]
MSRLKNLKKLLTVLRVALSLVAACTFSTVSSAALEESISQPPDDYVLVRRVIDARYFTPESVVSRPDAAGTQGSEETWPDIKLRPSLNLKEALQSNIAREITISEQDALSKVVLREYGFGQKNSLQAYAAIEEKIVELNDLGAPENLKAGAVIKIPALPRMALSEPNLLNKYNKIPKGSMYPSLSKVTSFDAFNPVTQAFTEKPVVSGDGRDGSPLVIEHLWLPKDYKDHLGGIELDQSYEEVQAQVISVNMESESLAEDYQSIPFLSAEERMIIKSKLSGQPKLKPVLIVLDDGWPNDEAFYDSRKFVSEALEMIKKRFNYPVALQHPSSQSRVFTDYPKEAFHARSIHKSLATLVELEPSRVWDDQRVRVVYIPLSTAQVYSKAMLEELVVLRLIDDFMLGARGDPVPDKEVKAKRKIARDIVKRLKQDIGVKDLSTDKAIIESALVFADLYAVASGNPYVVNFSWTTRKREHKFTHFDFNQGILVSAAGNSSLNNCKSCRPNLAYSKECECADNAAAEERWFAVRSVSNQDVVAVMNTARDGSLQCRSSIVGSRSVDPLAISFNGYVSDSICGTSFAAPRVAWLFAAKLAYIPPQEFSIYDAPDKGHKLREIVKKSRQGGASGDQYGLDIKKLFEN